MNNITRQRTVGIFGVVLCLVLAIAGCGRDPEPQIVGEVTYFPENERVGYVKVDCPDTTQQAACYRIAVRPSVDSREAPFLYPHVFRSLLPPQLCDTMTVSYIAPGSERNYLVTLVLTAQTPIDTVFEFVPRRTGNSQKHPDTCIYTPLEYVYSSSAKILGWFRTDFRDMFEVVRIVDRRHHESKVASLGGDIGMANDFSRIYYMRYGGPPVIGRPPQPTPITCYDIALDSSFILFKHLDVGPPFDQRSRTSPIYCTCTTNEPFSRDLCRIENDSLIRLTDFEPGIWANNFVLFPDSVEVYHRKDGDQYYGIRRTVVHESGAE